MAVVQWAESAIDDLDSICDYIAVESPASAAKLIKKVFLKIDSLKTHPELGHPIPEVPDRHYRRLHVSPVYIYYRTEKTKVYIVHIARVERELRLDLIKSRAKKQ